MFLNNLFIVEILKNIFQYSPESPLIFTKPVFWVFFFIVYFFFSLIYNNKNLRNAYLLLVSLFFYYKSGGFFIALLIIITFIDFWAGIRIANAKIIIAKKFYLLIAIISNLGLLFYYKYSYLFIDLINDLFGTSYKAVDWFSFFINSIINSKFDIFNIILPVGISFFTFQALSYIIDVYRNKTEPVNNIIDFGFYISFFPQLVAGPIVRAHEFIPQIYKDYRLTKEELGQAIFLILQGLIKKVVISDYISINYVDRIFESPFSYSGLENLFGVYGYSLQIYCDFSGYTDIAIGIGLLFGFKLPINFNSPYKAINIAEFWRRWHISLSTWLRDYLYIPLGGNRKGKLRTYINLMITMLLGGLWHGANLRFVLWGAIHGFLLVINKIFSNIIPSKFTNNNIYKKLSLIITFNLVSFAWIFFRADSITNAIGVFNQIFNNFNLSILFDFICGYYKIILIVIMGFIIHWLPSHFKESYRGWFIRLNYFFKAIIIILVFILIYQIQSSGIQPFIYFRF
jgi:D-alanyl-lipoteichoic acid acyltransferase DltB (MBOAT superfamily)